MEQSFINKIKYIKMSAHYLSLAACLLVFFACNGNKKEALAALEKAKTLYENAQYSAAKQTLCDLQTQYPREVELLKEALHLTRQIELKEQERNFFFCDSLLIIRQAEVDSIRQYFVLEKNPEYDVAGRYIEKKAAASSYSMRIQTGINESGDMYLKSVYKGKTPIRHNQLKISTSAGEYAQTEIIPFDGGANYTFKDDNTGLIYEIVTYQKGRDNGLIRFIYNYSTQKLTAQYLGGKTYSFVLTSPEVESLVKTLNFSTMLLDIQKLQKEKAKAEKRVQYIQSKL
ncbi:MAG: hypothetical protein LBP83_03955 [Dysgonamonadaceae bacterium]|nr:hypothetical protein [Dysgonamonadaceae bacterium]